VPRYGVPDIMTEQTQFMTLNVKRVSFQRLLDIYFIFFCCYILIIYFYDARIKRNDISLPYL
jgi:hypothetical protein